MKYPNKDYIRTPAPQVPARYAVATQLYER